MPPIYKPEVAARAIHWTALSGRHWRAVSLDAALALVACGLWEASYG